jgi:hypothetical protein
LVQGYDPLLNPKKEPSPRIMWLIDTASWVLPVLAAILSVGAGVEAPRHEDGVAAFLGIGGGIISAAGVLATGWASKIRDQRMAVAFALGNLSLNIASDAVSRTPVSF